jgi:beta-lactamase family protein
MRRPWAALAALATLGLAGASGGPKADPPDVLAAILGAHPEWFASVVANADEHRLQILYTQIDRDAANRPTFRSFPYRLTDAYFYPASTVKLPAAVLALEKLNDLAVPGLSRDTALRTEAGTPAQTAVERDPSKADGLPTIAHYIRKIFLVSDNDAFNRLYEFLGQKEINERLWRRGFTDARILRRLEAALDPEENRVTNPFVFFDGERVVYRQPLARNPEAWAVDRPDVRQGRGFLRDGKLVLEPFDFSHSNYLSVRTLQGVLKSVLFPEAVPDGERFHLTEDDYRFLYTSLSMLPRESAEPAYPDREEYWDSYGKYFLFGDSKAPIPSHVRIFNKVGEAYGYLIDDAYVVDFDAGVEFLLTAVILVNADGIFNDDKYEYDEIGLPFLARLGRAVYEHELRRERPRRPDLTRFRVHP